MRKFFIICWVLFAMTAVASAVSYFGLSEDWESSQAELIVEAGVPNPETCAPRSEQKLAPGDIPLPADVFAEIERQHSVRCNEDIKQQIESLRLRHLGIHNFGQFTITSGVLSASILLLIFLSYASFRIRKSENRMMNKIKDNWCPLLVLATVIWAVLTFGNEGFQNEEEQALVLGPFVIAMAIYFLFPNRKK